VGDGSSNGLGGGNDGTGWLECEKSLAVVTFSVDTSALRSTWPGRMMQGDASLRTERLRKRIHGDIYGRVGELTAITLKIVVVSPGCLVDEALYCVEPSLSARKIK
jgi:hypothetical protein